jgi:DNA-directed RNA polymerase sigma subunit (sigma70/sigma32)
MDVNRSKKSLNVAFRNKEVLELDETCALDIAEDGPHTLEEIGDLINVSRERVRQIIEMALRRIYVRVPKEYQKLLKDFLE